MSPAAAAALHALGRPVRLPEQWDHFECSTSRGLPILVRRRSLAAAAALHALDLRVRLPEHWHHAEGSIGKCLPLR